MKRPVLLLALSAATLLTITGCETTGDPTQGGLFGWSENKAQQRQTALRDVLYLEQDRTADARATGSHLRQTKSANASAIAHEKRELASLRSQLDEVDAAGGRGRTNGVRSEIERAQSDNSADQAKVDEIRREVRGLRKEYGLLIERQ